MVAAQAVKNQSETLADLAEKAIGKYFKQAVKYEQAVLEDTDPENLHQMRVAMRRLRAAIAAFKPSLVLPQAAQESDIAAIARRLGKLRDFDVIGDTLVTAYIPQIPDAEQQQLTIVLKKLGKQRRQLFKRVTRLLNGDRYDNMKRSLKRWLKQPDLTATAQFPISVVMPDLVLPTLGDFWLHPGWLVGTQIEATQPQVDKTLTPAAVEACLTTHCNAIHDLRKQAKRTRYQLKLFADFYPQKLKTAIARLTDIQETLGQIQDSQVLEAFLQDHIPQFRQTMPHLAAALTQQRYQAWLHWQTLQHDGLDAKYRNQLRSQLLQPTLLVDISKPTSRPKARRTPTRRKATATAKNTAKSKKLES
ncbi:MAG: CHAD domain-containing protein [Cyanobacteria bacterium P01_A01_bin.123]